MKNDTIILESEAGESEQDIEQSVEDASGLTQEEEGLSESPETVEEVEADSADGLGEEQAEARAENLRQEIQLSEEELDRVADETIEALRRILKYFGAEEAEIDEYEGEEGELIMDIVGDNLAILIGRHGKTLDSLQFLVSAIVSKKMGFRYPVIIDVEGYKQRRKQKLVSLAKASAARAIRQKQEVRLRPMNPYERRIVHIALKDDRRITTFSDGVEPDRYIVIKSSS